MAEETTGAPQAPQAPRTDAEAIASLSRQYQPERPSEPAEREKPKAKPAKPAEAEAEQPEDEETAPPEREAEESGDKPEPDEGGEELPESYELSEIAEALGLSEAEVLQRISIKTKDGAVTLAALQEGQLRDADYRKKTMQLAEEKRVFEEHSKRQLQALQQSQQQIGALAQLLVQELQLDDQRIEAMLKDEYADERAYRVAVAERDKKRQMLQGIYQQQQAQQAHAQEQTKQQIAMHNAKQEELLVSLMPDLKDPKKRQAFETNTFNFLESEGFSRDEIRNYFGNAWDARMVRIAHKARLYDKLKSEDLPKKLRAEKPPVLKPGTSQQTRREAEKQGLGKLRSNLAKAKGLPRQKADQAALAVLRAEIGKSL